MSFLYLYFIFFAIKITRYYFSDKEIKNHLPHQFVELHQIIRNTEYTFIHHPKQINKYRLEIPFDIKLFTTKANCKAHIDYEYNVVAIKITYPVPIPEKYLIPCYEYIGIVNEDIQNGGFKLNYKTRLITFIGGFEFKPWINELPPNANQYLNHAIRLMNLHLISFMNITLKGLSAEQAADEMQDRKMFKIYSTANR